MLKRFIESVWANNSLYCLAIPQKIVNADGSTKSYFKHKVLNSLDDVIAEATNLDMLGSDVYFAVGTLKERRVFNEKKDKWQTRTHENMGQFRAFILDLDCGDGKPYKNKSEALQALKIFTKRIGMPKPTIVDSGYGLHVYWTFTEGDGISADEWYEHSAKLKKITEFFKLSADPTRTADRSSVLRLPGTHNYKRGAVAVVEVVGQGEPTDIAELCKIIDAAINENDIAVSVSAKKSNAFSDIESNLTTYPKSSGITVYKKCKQMARVKEVGGPVGYATRASACSLIKHFDIVDYSVLWANDPDVELVKTQTEMMLNDSITDNPHTCDRFYSQYPDGCEGCSKRGKIKSPIVLGYEAQEANDGILQAVQQDSLQQEASTAPRSLVAPPLGAGTEYEVKQATNLPKANFFMTEDGIQVPNPPYPYKRDVHGHIICEPKDSDGALGDASLIYDYDIFPYERIWDSHVNCEMVRIRVKLPHDGFREIYTELYKIADNKSFGKEMAINGIIAGGQDRTQQLCTYMNLYIKHIQALSKSTENYPQLGWQKDNSVFVLPNKSFHESGTIEDCGVSAALKHAVSSFRQRGSLEEWKSIINTYTRPGYEAYAFGHLVGYGSLLFNFTTYHGAIVNMVGDSGSGKSTVLQTINSLFGHPDESMLTQIDTTNSKMNRIGVFNSISCTYDEITNIEPEELSQFCYAVSQGRAKHRLGQDSVEKENNTRWKMILTSTSNANLMNKLSSLKQDASAESLRVFEFYINSQNAMTKSEASDVFDKLQDNFGHAGEIFIKEVIQKKDKVKDLIKAMTKTFDERADVPVKERYWSSIVGCTLAGGLIAKRLGLCDFDMDALMDWAVVQVKQMRAVVNENKRDPRSLLVEYMNSIAGNTIVIGGGVDKDRNQYVREEAHGAILARCEIDAGIMYVSKTSIRNWFTKAGTDINWVKKTLLQNGILTSENKDKILTAGSNVAKTGQTRCWVINLHHPEMAGVQIKVVSPIPVSINKSHGAGNV